MLYEIYYGTLMLVVINKLIRIIYMRLILKTFCPPSSFRISISILNSLLLRLFRIKQSKNPEAEPGF